MKNALQNFATDVKENPIQYSAYVIMAFFTFHAVNYFTGNLVLAVGAFVLAEGGSRFWEVKFRVAENDWQSVIAGVAFVISAAAAIATDLASAAILASEMQIFDLFATVPEWAQITVTFVTVIMAAVQILMATAYKWFSDTDKIIREKLKKLSAMEVENKNAIKIAKADAELEIQRVQVARMKELAIENARTEGDKRAVAEFEKLVNSKPKESGVGGSGSANFTNGR